MTSLHDRLEPVAKAICGVLLHAALGMVGGILLGGMISWVIYAITGNPARQTDILPFLVSSALVAFYATRRWFGYCGPWVGLLGLILLCVGTRELAWGWSPAWSHQSRSDYVMSQLFCVKGGSGDSEGFYALFFGGPFLCLSAYSLASFITLRITKPRRLS